jgi:hypothetical protein
MWTSPENRPARYMALRGLLVSLVVLSMLPAWAAPPQASASYCNIWVPGNTDCANVSGGSWHDGYFDQNVAWDPNGWLVCQHTYIHGTGTTVSRHCGGTPQGAGNDLMCYYAEGRELSGHAGNDNSFEQPIIGETGIEKVTCV